MAAPATPPIRLGLIGTEGVLALAGSSERRVTRCGSDATTHTTVFRGIGSECGRSAASRRAWPTLALDPVPGAGPVPLWRPRGSTGLPGRRISSSASFAA